MSVYRLEIFNQALEPVDVAPISRDTEIVDDFVTIENYEIIVPKLVDVERGHVLRIMDSDEEIAVALVSEAEQTKTETRITASPLISILDFDTLQPIVKGHAEFSSVWYDMASNQLMAQGVPALEYRSTPYISMTDTGAWLASALAVKCRPFIGSGATDPTYCINDWDDSASNTATSSPTTIDGDASQLTSLFDWTMNGGTKYQTVNVFDVFVKSRALEGRTFRAFFDFSGTRPRLRIYMRKAQESVMTIDADLPNIINKEINIATDEGAANRCSVYLAQGTEYIRRYDYYRHADGTIDEDPTDPIVPVISVNLFVDYDNSLSLAENKAACDDIAANAMTVTEPNNKIALTVRRDDQILDFDTMRALSSATVLHHGNTYTAAYTGCRIKGDLVTYYFGNARTDLTSKIAIAMREGKKEDTARPFDPWEVAVPPGSALTSNNGIQQISGGSVSAASAYGSYIIANVSGKGYTTATRTNGQGRMMTINKDGEWTETQTASLTIDSSIKWVIAHRTASSQAVLRLAFS